MSAPSLVQPEHWIAVADRLPEQHQEVLVLIADPTVAIYAHPTVARIDIFVGSGVRVVTWWAGVPGRWMKLPADGWTVTHWTPMPTWRDGHWMTRGSCLATDR